MGELARAAGVSKSTLSTWERGLRQPCLPELDAVLLALHAPEEARDQALSLVDAPRARRALEGSTSVRFRPALMAALRARAGLDQADLAHCLGVRQSSVSRWERGETEPSEETLRRFADLTHATASEWFALTRPAPYGDGTGLDNLEARFLSVTFGASMPKDVEFLLLRRALANVRCARGRELRAKLAIRHTQCLSECGRVRETLSAVIDATALAEKEGLSREEIVPVVIAEASVTRSPERALRVLATLDGEVRSPVLRAWVVDERAYHLARSGEIAQGVVEAQKGVDLADALGHDAERYYRCRGAGRTFVMAGLVDRAARALDCPRPSTLPITSIDHLVRIGLSAALGDEEAKAYHRERAASLAQEEGRLLQGLMPTADRRASSAA